MEHDLQQIQALAQRGLSDKQIKLALGYDAFDDADYRTIEKGRAEGIVMLNTKLFDQALAGDIRAMEYLNRRFEEAKNSSGKKSENAKSYTDRQLEILRKKTKK